MRARQSIDEEVLGRLAAEAWRVRENARILGDTKVGCAVLTSDGRIFGGCNIEHKFRCHDVHAEVNAISSMIAGGGSRLAAVVIAAARERFTPCGGCMDWIFEFGQTECIVAFQGTPGGPLETYLAGDLMPFYPA